MPNAVSLNNFSYRYPDGSVGLEEISLEIDHGEKVALIGANGSGKSTLLLAMGVFIKGKGEIEIDGIRSVSKNASAIRLAIGTVLQNPDEQLFMPTIFEDVAFGPLNMGFDKELAHKKTHEALNTVGLGEMGHKAPHHLSAGQKRAAAIATILSMNPKIITMDEPDTSLDPASRNNLTGLLAKLPQTLIIATCSMNFAAAACSRCIVIANGKIAADGKSEKILTNDKLMEAHGLETASPRFINSTMSA